MIFPSNRVRVVVATKPVDFRKQHDGLVAYVKSALRKEERAAQGPFHGDGVPLPGETNGGAQA